MAVDVMLDRIFQPYREPMAVATFAGLGAVDRLVGLSLQDEAANLLHATNRSLTALRRDYVVVWLQRVFDGTPVRFIPEHSWINVLIPSDEANIRVRIKRFEGENGEQQSLAGTQLQLAGAVEYDVADIDVTLGWHEGAVDWIAYLAYVTPDGICEWKMTLEYPGGPDGRVLAVPPASPGPEGDVGGPRVRRLGESTGRTATEAG